MGSFKDQLMQGRNLFAAAAIFALGASAHATAAETFKVDAVHSSVVYSVKHMNVSMSFGRFNKIDGSFSLDPADPTKGRLEFTVPTDSIDTGNTARDGHLKGPDFFNAKQFPTITFKSKSVASAGPSTFDVKGDLTLHGVTKEVAVKVELTGTAPGMRGGKIAGILSEFTIKRSDFGMKNPVGPIGDDVRIIVSIEGAHP